MRKTRKEYVEECTKTVREMFDKKEILVSYLRNHLKQKIGCVVGWRDGNDVAVGWSKCNLNGDRFDRFIGIKKAMSLGAREPSDILYLDAGPVNQAILEMKQRGRRYFKLDESPVAQ